MNSTDSTRGDASTAAVKHTAVSSPFVWIPTEVKRLFQVFNLSPTFIGASFTTKCIPVLLWPEQRSYLQTKEKEIHGESRASNSATRQTKKRKFDETADSEADATGVSSSDALVVHNESDTKRKRMRTGFYDTVARFASLTSINFRSLVSFFSVPGFRRKAGNNSIEKRDSIDRDALHRNKVFHDLQSKSYFIGAGDIYGGDYCLYIGGDPSTVHSTATLRVVTEPHYMVSVKDLTTFARVQNQVAKNTLFGFVHPTTGEPRYLNINFDGVSDRL